MNFEIFFLKICFYFIVTKKNGMLGIYVEVEYGYNGEDTRNNRGTETDGTRIWQKKRVQPKQFFQITSSNRNST